jgi:peptide/nickel transport system substrate-binding protein
MLRRRRLTTTAAAVVLTAAILTACSSGGSSGSGGNSSSATTIGNGNSSTTVQAGKKRAGGTLTVASDQGNPNFIFPLPPATNTDGYNVNLTQPLWPYLAYPGDGAQSAVGPQESLYSSLKYTDGDKTITIVLKPWKWSNGTPITSRDFTFVYNLLAANKTDWEAYIAGLFPDNVSGVAAPNPKTIVIHLAKAFNPTFYTDNVLTEIPLLPQQAWDKESPSGPVGNYDQTPAGAKAVWKFLQKEGGDIATFATNPLWKVVDGPWTLSSFRSDGYYSYAPNRAYSGPDKPSLSSWIEQPYTTDTAEFDALRAGGTLDLGGLPQNDLGQIASLKSEGYSIADVPVPGVAGIIPNFYSPKARYTAATPIRATAPSRPRPFPPSDRRSRSPAVPIRTTLPKLPRS